MAQATMESSSSQSVSAASSGANPQPQYFVDSTKGNIKEIYSFQQKLANGGFGIVYLAEHRESHQKFAIKAIQKKKVKDYTTFINEINILKVLDHPNIIKLHEIWEWNDVCFLVLEYCEGGELFHFILERKHLNEREAAMIMHQLLSALVYLHGQNISHRDIKPENFMLSRKSDPTCVKMIDFGLSKDFSGQETMKTMSGSPYYIAPEVFLQNYNSKIDIWSLGVVLYIMLSGKVPFPGNSELEIIGNVIKGDFHFNHEPFSRHSPEAKEFLQCLIKKDVNQRYTAEQAFNHPWIQNHSELSDQTVSMDTMADMELTVRIVEIRKAVLSYFCQEVTEQNLIALRESLHSRDPNNTGNLSYEEFQQGLQEGNMPILPREFQIIASELDPEETGRIRYKVFLNEVYITKMYLKELHLYNTLQEADTQGRGGVTIAEMKQILAGLDFPEEALGAAFQAMLKADINQIEPECIIDTQKFLQSLHREFSSTQDVAAEATEPAVVEATENQAAQQAQAD